jgi:hypothetical protein
MPSALALLGILVLGIVITIGFAFTLIGFVGEAIGVLALLGLVGRGIHYIIRESRAPKATG